MLKCHWLQLPQRTAWHAVSSRNRASSTSSSVLSKHSKNHVYRGSVFHGSADFVLSNTWDCIFVIFRFHHWVLDGQALLRFSWDYLLNYLVISAEAIPSTPSWLCSIGLRWILISAIETLQVLLCRTKALLVAPGGKHYKQYMFRLEFLHECNIVDGPFGYSRSGNRFWMFQYTTGNGDVGSTCRYRIIILWFSCLTSYFLWSVSSRGWCFRLSLKRHFANHKLLHYAARCTYITDGLIFLWLFSWWEMQRGKQQMNWILMIFLPHSALKAQGIMQLFSGDWWVCRSASEKSDQAVICVFDVIWLW